MLALGVRSCARCGRTRRARRRRRRDVRGGLLGHLEGVRRRRDGRHGEGMGRQQGHHGDGVRLHLRVARLRGLFLGAARPREARQGAEVARRAHQGAVAAVMERTGGRGWVVEDRGMDGAEIGVEKRPAPRIRLQEKVSGRFGWHRKYFLANVYRGLAHFRGKLSRKSRG